MAEEYPAAYLQVKVEPSDSEYNPIVDELDESENDDVSLNLELSRLQLSPQQTQRQHQEHEQVVKQMKQELEHAHKIITDQSCELEKSEKKIEELQENINHQEELLTRMEYESAKSKAKAEAENSYLRKVLEQERQRRIFSEQKYKKLLKSRKSVPSFKQRSTFSPTFNTPSSIGGRGIMDRSALLGSTLHTSASSSGIQSHFTPGENESDSNEDEVVVVDVIEKQVNNSRIRRSSLFPCTTCGLTFNTGWKLLGHLKCHRVQSNFGKNSRVTKPPLQQREVKSVMLQSEAAKSSKASNVMIDVQPEPSSSHQPPMQDIRNKQFWCMICKNRFAIVSQLKIHLKKAHGIVHDKFSIGCSECGKVFSTRKQHVRHRRIVHGTLYSTGWKERCQNNKQPSQATDANMDTNLAPAETTLQSQSSTNQMIMDTIPPAVPGPSRNCSQLSQSNEKSKFKHGVDAKNPRAGWFCLCGRNFMKSNSLREHIRYYAQERKHTCHICGHAFTGLISLKLHMSQVHQQGCTVTKMVATAAGGNTGQLSIGPTIENADGQYPTVEPSQNAQEVTTNAANATTPANQNKTHQLVGDDPITVPNAKYKCSCGRQYATRSSFNIHVHSKNTGRIFKCSLCPRSFELHGNLKSHVRQAHKTVYRNGRYACGNCAQTFESSTLLVRHRILCKYRNNRNDKVLKQKK